MLGTLEETELRRLTHSLMLQKIRCLPHRSSSPALLEWAGPASGESLSWLPDD